MRDTANSDCCRELAADFFRGAPHGAYQIQLHCERGRSEQRTLRTDRHRIDRLLQRAQELRELYVIQNDKQRAPFFELQTKDFALIAIDTGIRRTVDDRQRAWISNALKRASGKFTIAIVGHPKFAAGQDTSQDDADFTALYAMLERAGVGVMMAGDTHAFEYDVAESGEDRNPRRIHYFVDRVADDCLSYSRKLVTA